MQYSYFGRSLLAKSELVLRQVTQLSRKNSTVAMISITELALYTQIVQPQYSIY